MSEGRPIASVRVGALLVGRHSKTSSEPSGAVGRMWHCARGGLLTLSSGALSWGSDFSSNVRVDPNKP